MGHDAWNILPWLQLMQKDPDFIFAGYSGHYRSGFDKDLNREPGWAVFKRGRPAPLIIEVAEDDSFLFEP